MCILDIIMIRSRSYHCNETFSTMVECGVTLEEDTLQFMFTAEVDGDASAGILPIGVVAVALPAKFVLPAAAIILRGLPGKTSDCFEVYENHQLRVGATYVEDHFLQVRTSRVECFSDMKIIAAEAEHFAEPGCFVILKA